MNYRLRNSFLALALCFFQSIIAQPPSAHLQVSGVYPHLAVFNEGEGLFCKNDGHEGGIGAVVPWAGKLWLITYSPHCPDGSSDKLYSVDSRLNLSAYKGSVGGTPASRLIHRESNQLIIGPYFVDSVGGIRVIPPSVMPGRLTATARHLTDPANKVYFYDMEGMLYEADVNSLAVKKLFHKPVPGWHGKGAYTSQKQLVIANNGEHRSFDIAPEHLQAGGAPKTSEELGVLASWNGNKWKVIERKQFTDVTGPGGIYGAPDDAAPLWSIGWDKRSVILKLLDKGNWYTYRLPKATHTYDHKEGWYTEWPRIRAVGGNKMLMDMHGLLYDFPKTFSYSNSAGILPLSTHLRYIPDFCEWNGKIVLATDETSILQNPLAGRSQSNLWFGSLEDIKSWGAAAGWGGPWINDTVKANGPSDPFLLNGFGKRLIHLAHQEASTVVFTLEIDAKGANQWTTYKSIPVDKTGYAYHLFPSNVPANWVRIKADKDCIATAYFHLTSDKAGDTTTMFRSLAGIDDKSAAEASFIRPAAHNKNLQVLSFVDGKTEYKEVAEGLEFIEPSGDSTQQMLGLMEVKKNFTLDEASVIVNDSTGTFRLPKTSEVYDLPFAAGWPRERRELESERYMLNVHGTFYEIGRESGLAAIRPITTHKKRLMDFCTWRGLLVMSGTKLAARPDGHYFKAAGEASGLWFGAIDDLWKMGKPVGEGGVWKNSQVKAGQPSLPFLMTGYDKKTISLRADKDVAISLEVDFDHNGWHPYKTVNVRGGQTTTFAFPDGFSAHWIRATADKDCKATVWLVYE